MASNSEDPQDIVGAGLEERLENPTRAGGIQPAKVGDAVSSS